MRDKKSQLFRFKQFVIDQTGCAMKVNTDGVLLGALAEVGSGQKVLDIGTGTGVVALMLAQRNAEAQIEAVEIDPEAGVAALRNFETSPFSSRLKLFRSSFQEHFAQFPLQRYDLIVSNPPFFLNSLKNPDHQKTLARHTDQSFFSDLVRMASRCLNEEGELCLILPEEAVSIVTTYAKAEQLFIHRTINIKSFPDSAPHRMVICLGFYKKEEIREDVVIYQAEKVYSAKYKELLKDFLTIF